MLITKINSFFVYLTEKFTESNSKESNSGAKVQQSVSPVALSGQLEFWNDQNEAPLKFDRLGALYSELIAIGIDGKLYQWKWSSPRPVEVLESFSKFFKNLYVIFYKIF